MSNEPVNILLVDDFEPFRAFVCSMLRGEPQFQVIAEASDGLAAVQKAEELQPDLILLDIGLPNLNGIEAARRIRRLSPKSKILFVSQESSTSVVQEALATGASGYVLKSNAQGELLVAMHAVLLGEQFVGSKFVGRGIFRASDEKARKGSLSHENLRRLQRQDKDVAVGHDVEFYSDEVCFLDGLTQFIGAALKAGNSAIVFATEPHRDSLLPRLQVLGLDVGAAIEQGRYIALDAAETLAIFMVNGLPDPVRFVNAAGGLFMQAAQAAKGSPPRVAVYGECGSMLWTQDAEAGMRIEHLLNEIAAVHDVDILCGYALSSLHGEHGSHNFQQICAVHSAAHFR